MPNGPWRSLFSWATLVSGILAVSIWSVVWGWLSGVVFVLLLYAHEAGHVLAAVWRKVPVRRAPVFIPGLGAFVLLDPSPSLVNRLVISFGGPLAGVLAALEVNRAGFQWGLLDVAYAGEIALWLNIINLAPLQPLDGGNIVAITGWIGLLPALIATLAIILWAPDPFFLALATLGLYLGLRTARHGEKIHWYTSLAVLAIYILFIILFILLAVLFSEHLHFVGSRPAGLLVGMDTAIQIFLVWLMTGGLALEWLKRHPSGFGIRYPILLLLGWPVYLLASPALLFPVTILALESLGLPVFGWNRQFLHRLSRNGNPAAGYTIAMAYEYFRRTGRPERAEAILADYLPEINAAGGEAALQCGDYLRATGFQTLAIPLLRLAVETGKISPEKRSLAANNLAWVLYRAGRAAEAEPFALIAVAGNSSHPASLGTLGCVQLALMRPDEAEKTLRKSLQNGNHVGTRAALAQAIAALGRYAEAAGLMAEVLKYKGRWPEDEPTREELRLLAEKWAREASKPAT